MSTCFVHSGDLPTTQGQVRDSLLTKEQPHYTGQKNPKVFSPTCLSDVQLFSVPDKKSPFCLNASSHRELPTHWDSLNISLADSSNGQKVLHDLRA